MHLAVMVGKLVTATRPSTLKSADRKPPSHCALNGLGILCLEMCYRSFTVVARTGRRVQRTLLLGTAFFEDFIVRWTRGDRPAPCPPHPPSSPLSVRNPFCGRP